MRAINHALTGAAIGVVVGQPIVALPLALASHFICDALPHFDIAQPEKQKLKSKLFRDMLIIDTMLCVALVLVLALYRPRYWILAAVCAFVAAAPDFSSMPRYIRTKRGQREVPRRNMYQRFAKRIQWFERPIGAVVEIAWFAAMVIILVPFLRHQ